MEKQGNGIEGHESSLFHEAISEDLKRSGISLELAQKFGWQELPAIGDPQGELKNILGFRNHNGHNLIKESSAILVFPYFNEQGKVIFRRVKFYGVSEEVPKYLQPSNIPIEPYILPPVWEIKDKPHKPLIIVEGEKKALCLHQNGFNPIGLAGVYCFKSKNSGQVDLLRTLDKWQWHGRTVHICFDSDAIYNANVRKAEIEIAIKLIARDAIVKIIRLPQLGHTEKIGVDDFITHEGVQKFQELYNKALPLEKAYSKEYLNDVLSTIARTNLPKLKEDVLIETFSKEWRISKKILLGYVSNVREQAKSEAIVFTQDEKEKALRLLKETPYILDKLIEITESFGHIGEEINRKTLYLSAVSSKTDQSISCYIKGQSSAGKNDLVDSIAKLIPSNICNKLSDLSPKSLYHLDKDLSHKILYIAEIGGSVQSDYSLRVAQSEGELIYIYPIKNPITGEFKTIEKRIPAKGMVLWLTTVKLRIDEQNQTRGFDLFIDESKEQTRRILEIKAKNEVLEEIEKEKMEREKRIWQRAFTLIESYPVYVPYSQYLAQRLPTDKIRIRRDFQRFLALIKANCLLHQFQREKVEIQGKTFLIADLDDYRVAYDIGSVILRQTLQELSPQQEKFLKEIEIAFRLDEFQPKDTENLIDVGYEQRRKLLRNLVNKGYLSWNGKKGTLSRYSLVKSASEGVKLPHPQEIEKNANLGDTQLPNGGKTQTTSTKTLGNGQNTQYIPNTPRPKENMIIPEKTLGNISLPNENVEIQPTLNDRRGLGNHKVIPLVPNGNAELVQEKGILGNWVLDERAKNQNYQQDENISLEDGEII